jgi:hypothetical protein
MPLDDGGRLDQHHGVQGPWPKPVKAHPEKTVGVEEPGTAWALTPQDRLLVSKGDELQFQRRAAAKPERQQGNQSRKNRDHAADVMVAAW